MRITAIEIENFKGIGDRVRLELAPITLLFGANSAGKSTVLHALLYLRDVLEKRNLDAISTSVSGNAVDLGGFKRFVNQQDMDRTIRISVHLEVQGHELPDMASDEGMVGTFIQRGGEITINDSGESPEGARRVNAEIESAMTTILNKMQSAQVAIEVRWDHDLQRPIPQLYEVHINGEELCRIERENEVLKLRSIELASPAGVSLPGISEDDLERSGDEARRSLMALMDAQDGRPVDDIHESLSTILLYIYFHKKPVLSGLNNWLSDPHDPIPDFSFQKAIELPLVYGHSELTEEIESTVEAVETSRLWARKGTVFLAKLLFGPGRLLRDWLQDLKYIGPLRTRPPREGVHESQRPDWAEGLAAWKALEEIDSDSFMDISNWLSSEDRLNSGYGVIRKRIIELDEDSLDKQLSGRLTKTALRGLKKNAHRSCRVGLYDRNSGLEFTPSEVGVGISQVLPVLVASLNSPENLIFIEQPELHIHPAMQVVLGDLFIEGALKKGTQFLIETHSEHLILRLLRRIREVGEQHSDAPDPCLKPEDVAVIWVERTADGVKMERQLIDESGEFTKPWPKGFFEERAGELF